MKRKVFCSHPDLYPTQWNQSKPEIWEGYTCDCGQNWCCPICGFGQASWPCDCDWTRTAEKVLTEHADVWKRLAKQ